MKPTIAMTIGGSDPSAGAGIQADLKAFTALDVHGVSILTCITVQNTQTVKKIIPLPPGDIKQQIDHIVEDIPIHFVKTGLLYQPEIARIIAAEAKKHKWTLVVDPVLVATSGDTLSTTNLTEEIKNTLLPVSTIITPNIPEAEALTNSSINSTDDMKNAAKKIHTMGAKYVIIKGGHQKEKQANDLYYDGEQFIFRSLPRIPQKKAHGSGCTFSALLTGLLSKEYDVEFSFILAKAMVWNMINTGYHLGKGSDVLQITSKIANNAPYSLPTSDHVDVWMTLSRFLQDILDMLPLSFIPEVGMNIGYALQHAKSKEDICALNGRIIRSTTKAQRCGTLQFGSSKHIASIILAVMKTNPDIRCAMNIKYSPKNLSLCEQTSYRISSFDRTYEPKDVSSTMEWGTKTAIEQSKTCPDIIYDKGGIGKEPMIRILGKNPEEVYTKLICILKQH
jgi:hydroxymethylpyrimidine kinase / phosphomethylpyrimidine kinase / thiamine-phosphate diphosphorylase